MAYGKLKADTIIYDNSGSDVEVLISTLDNKATTTGDTFTGDVLIDNQKDLRLGEADSNGTNYVALQAPAAISSNVTWTLPAADGSASQMLATDGSGVLSWTTPSASDSTKMPLAGGNFTGDVQLNAQKDLRFADSDSSHYVALQAPATVSSNVTWTLPATDGSANQHLKTDGSGALGWATDVALELLDEDNMATDSATKVPSQQSVKAYVDAHIIDEDNFATNSATKPASQQSVKAYVDTADATKANLSGATFTGNVSLGTNSVDAETFDLKNQGGAYFREQTGNGTNYIVLHAPDAIAANEAWKLPASVGTSGQALTTDGNGSGLTPNLSWSTVGDVTLAGAQSFTGVKTFNAAAVGEVTALTDGATIATDLALSNNFSVTLAGNRTLGQPTNQAVGQSGSIFVTQDGTGSRTLAYHADFKWAGGTAPTLSTAAAAVDRIDYVVAAANKIHAVISLDVK